jgi:hypothetical protein
MRLSQKSKKSVLMWIFFGSMLSASAQRTFKYEAAIKKVDSSGFYKITLQPAFVAISQASLFDVRLMDANGRFIPYVNGGNIPVDKGEIFLNFPQVKTLAKTDSGTSITVENKASQPISRIWIKLKNTAVIRTMSLLGSDDLNKWFAIEEGVPLAQPDLNSNGAYVQSFTFPASNYHYLKILVNDKNKTPVKFLEAGIYMEASAVSRYQLIVPVKFRQYNDDKKSNITIELNGKYLVNKVHLNIIGPRYFKRTISVYSADTGYGLDVHSPQLISESELTSSGSNDIFLSAKTNMISLGIDNEDNLPLKITGIQAYQADQYIMSYLEAGQQYKLLTGDTGAKEPNYDLKFFTDSLHGYLQEISHGPVMKNTAYTTTPKIIKHDYSLLIWMAIAVALVLLSFLTLKMIKEVNTKTTGN